MEKNRIEMIKAQLRDCFEPEQVRALCGLLDQMSKPPPPKRGVPSRRTVINKTVKYMKSLGTYRKEFEQVIEIYADMVCQYNYLSKQFEDGGFKVSTDTERNGEKKSPILVCLENLRKDIGTYSDRLMLNAKTYNAEIEKPQEEPSPFAALMARHQKT